MRKWVPYRASYSEPKNANHLALQLEFLNKVKRDLIRVFDLQRVLVVSGHLIQTKWGS